MGKGWECMLGFDDVCNSLRTSNMSSGSLGSEEEYWIW